MIRRPPRSTQGRTLFPYTTLFRSADARGDEVERLVPADPAESRLPPPPHHRVRQATQRAQLVASLAAQAGEILQGLRVQSRHGVQPEKPQPEIAQVDARQRPVRHPCGPQRASVADASPQDPPGQGELIFVLPQRLPDFQVVVRTLLADAE